MRKKKTVRCTSTLSLHNLFTFRKKIQKVNKWTKIRDKALLIYPEGEEREKERKKKQIFHFQRQTHVRQCFFVSLQTLLFVYIFMYLLGGKRNGKGNENGNSCFKGRWGRRKRIERILEWLNMKVEQGNFLL